MALTPELLKKQPELTALTEEQVNAITNLSLNDENIVIGERTGKIYGDLDNDIKSTFGIDKTQGEKSYNYLKRVGQSMISELAQLKQDTEKLKKDKESIEEKIKGGTADAALKQQLKDAEVRFEQLNDTYTKEKAQWDTKHKEKTNEVNEIRLGFEFEKAQTTLKFRPEIDDGLKTVLINAAKQKILTAYKPEYIEAQSQWVFRDEKGNIVNNPDKGLNPFTADELLRKELTKALAENKSGAGTQKPTGKGADATLNLGGAKSQVEADELIKKHLMSMGLTVGSTELAHKHKELRKESGVEKLPIR